MMPSCLFILAVFFEEKLDCENRITHDHKMTLQNICSIFVIPLWYFFLLLGDAQKYVL